MTAGKIIQITSATGSYGSAILYALTDQGKVYQWDCNRGTCAGAWVELIDNDDRKNRA